MPSALETLVKILKLERDQGCKNTAVIGGFSAYTQTWHKQAREQARKPEHHILVDELVDGLNQYESIEPKLERQKRIAYMLDRIMGRTSAPPEYLARLQNYTAPAAPENVTEVISAETPPTAERFQKPRSEPPKQPEQRNKPEYRDHKPRQGDSKPFEKRERQERPPRQEQPKHQHNKVIDEDEGDEIEEVVTSGIDDFVPAPPKRGSGQRGQYSRPREMQLDIKPPPRLARPPRKPRPERTPEEAVRALNELKARVTAVKGVGPQQSGILENIGIFTLNDMLFYFPRRYDDYTRLLPINKLKPEMIATVIGTVDHAELRTGNNNRKDFFMVLDDGSGKINVTFFGQKFLINTIRPGQQVVLSGKVSIFAGRLQMTNPDWEKLDSENLHTIGIVPVYSLTEGLKPRSFRKQMKQVIDDYADQVPDYMPLATLERAELGDLGWAIRQMHFPEGWDHLNHARRRLMFDELILLQLAIMQNRRDWQSVEAQPLNVTDDFLEPFIQAIFPYELTNAQQRAIADIRRDVSKNVPMNRLIQGDVGAGKTAVALVAMAMAVSNSKQAAIMAPTSILAEQHYRNISSSVVRWPGEQKPVIALLTSALTQSERESIYRGLADGSIDIAIGTHALIQEGVDFKDLAVAVIDEQHRFGVEQRGRLRGKGGNPHLLVMTATPIPRTLALTMYADLDLTVIDEKPPGRQPIETRIVLPNARERVYSFVESQIKQGRQAFMVHPLVEASDKIDAASAVEAFERLSKIFFRYKVCLLHGRMKPTEKDEIMEAFARREYDIMVTTSVAEVGVDIPNASVMVIEGANRFGLAQLHQFRGRVGRGEHQSYCILIPDNNTEESEERLKAMEDSDDGFKLAEVDWKLRGPGDLVGTRQSGQSILKLAEDMTPELVSLAQREARTIYEEDMTLTQPQHHLLSQRVDMLYRDESDVS